MKYHSTNYAKCWVLRHELHQVSFTRMKFKRVSFTHIYTPIHTYTHPHIYIYINTQLTTPTDTLQKQETQQILYCKA